MARAIVLPVEADLIGKLNRVDIDTLKEVRRVMRQAFADTYKDTLLKIYKNNKTPGEYSPETKPAAKRALKNVALGYLALTEYKDLVWKQYQEADNLTDRLTALNIIVNNGLEHKQEVLADFYKRYEGDDLVLNKWFVIQASDPIDDALATVKKLIKHPVFDYKNPNKVRAVLGGFGRNLGAFNRADGKGYDFYAKQCAILDKINPKITSNLLTAFSKFKKFDKQRQDAVKTVLTKLLNNKKLSINARETIERILT